MKQLGSREEIPSQRKTSTDFPSQSGRNLPQDDGNRVHSIDGTKFNFERLMDGNAISLCTVMGQVFRNHTGIGVAFSLSPATIEGPLLRILVKFRANIDFLKIRYAEKGFLEKLVTYLASVQEKRPSKIRRNFPKLIDKMMLSNIPASIDSKQEVFLKKSVNEVKKFLKYKGILTISMRPEDPILVEELSELLQEMDFDSVNLSIYHDRKGYDEAIYKTSIFDETIKGDPEEAHDLALRFLKGEGVPQNFAKALALIEHGRSSGDPEVHFLLATIYANGIVPPRDLKKAYRSALLAGAMGYGRATKLLSRIENELEANTIFLLQRNVLITWMASEDAKFLIDKTRLGMSGDVTAMRQLAVAYRRGYNVPRNYFDAYIWSTLAVAAGDRVSVTIRESLLSAAIKHNLLTGAQIVAAQEKASTLWQSGISQALTQKVGSSATK